MTASAYTFSSCSELTAALVGRTISAVELTNLAIERIERFDHLINAVVVHDYENARTAAVAADAALARGERLPLLGIPITVKESYNVVGMPTTWGMPDYAGWLPKTTAESVNRLRAAGAIVLGKTNVPYALSDWQSFNDIYGRTNNPWDFTRTPGGSSGGGAAALAAGFISLELGSDIAGSLRAPAHYCGIFAHKPSYGLVPMAGHAPPTLEGIAPSIDLAVGGPMARTALDLKLALDVLVAGAGKTTGDRWPLLPARHHTLRDFRILVVDRHPMLPISQSVQAALDHLVHELAAAGATVKHGDPSLPDLLNATQIYLNLLRLTSQAPSAPAVLVQLESAVSVLLASSSATKPCDRSELAEARRNLTDQWHAVFREWDVVICPAMPTQAFLHDERISEQRSIRIGGEQYRYFDQVCWSSLATGVGLPATVAPISFASGELPIGIQILGPARGDYTTLAFADLISREFGGFVPPPAFH